MPSVSELESTLTDRYQTTIPQTVRHALRLNKRDKIHYTIRDGEVIMTRAQPVEADDPLLASFLDFLGQDIHAHPEHLRSIDAEFVERLQALTAEVAIDLDAPLTEENE